MTDEPFEQLVLRYFDNDLSHSEFAVLQDTLANSAEARSRYHQLAELHGLLATVVRQPMPQPVAVSPRRAVVPRRVPFPAERPKSWLMTGLAAAAAVVFAALALNVYWVRTRQPLVTFRAAPGALMETTHSASESGSGKPGANALGVGSRMRLRHGAVALDFSSGVKAIVSGPADFTVTSKTQLRLDDGRARFTVPPKAIGFKVAANGLEVLDLGTEFGVVARQAGHGAEVHVFTGKVSATPSGGRGEVVPAGLARLAEEGSSSMREIPLAPSLFPSRLPSQAIAHAANANGTWNVDADGAWNVSANWSGSTIADGAGFTAFFTNHITAARTVTLGVDRTIGNVTFSDSGAAGSAWTITTGNTLTLGDIGAGGLTPTITTISDATIASNLAGNDGFTKLGAGTLTLSATNTYSGLTTVSAGTLVFSPTTNTASTTSPATIIPGSATINNAGVLKIDFTNVTNGMNFPHAILNGSSGSTTINAGATLELFADSLHSMPLASPGTAVLLGATLSGSGTVKKTGAGVVDFFSAGPGSGFTGMIHVQDGVLSFQTVAGAYSGQSAINIASLGTVDSRTSGIIIVDALTGTGVVSSSVGTGALSVGNNGGSGTFSGIIANGANAGTRNGKDGSWNGTLSLTKNGAGTQTLSGANAYSGGTTINGGTLLVNNTTGSGLGTGAVSVVSGATLGGTGTVTGITTVNGTIRGGNGTTASGTLAMGGNVVLADGSIIELSLGKGGAHSSLAFNSAVSFDPIGGNQAFHLRTFGATPGTYTGLITGVTTNPGTTRWTISSPGWVGTFTWNAATRAIDLKLTTVPASVPVTPPVSR